MADKDICGGVKDDGGICEHTAGWGRKANDGPCRHHSDERRPPDKLTHDRIDAIANDLAYGHSFRVAVEANDVSERRAYDWIDEATDIAPDENSEYAERMRTWLQKVTRSRASGRMKLERAAIDDATGNYDPHGDAEIDGKLAVRILREILGGENSQAAQRDDDRDAGRIIIPDEEQLDELLTEPDP